MRWIEHPLRRQVVGEMHLRRWPAIAAPMLIVQLLRLVDADQRNQEQSILTALPPGWTRNPSDNPRHHEGTWGEGWQWVWEQHNEASALTLFVHDADRAMLLDEPPDGSPLSHALDWMAGLPGMVIRATRISVVADDRTAEDLLPQFAFIPGELVSCHVGHNLTGRARLWSDFRLGSGRFGRLLVAANGTVPSDLSRVIQSMQELGNYRNLALLGLPEARAGWRELDRIERELVELSGEVARPEVSDEAMLERVCALSLAIMSLATSTNYRMSATQAYATLVDERLAELAPESVPGYQSLADFTRRRLQPAVRTCAAHVKREEDLASRAEAFVSLLRTRVETRMEEQNARSLEATRRSVDLQVRIQQLVEGLSVVALTYYIVGLLGYVLKGLEHTRTRFDAAATLALLTPVVLVAVTLILLRIKRSLFADAADD